MTRPILTVMAAGLGSRYGSLKQIDPVGHNGEILMDYAIYDAIRAGFERVIFIIRRSMEEEFKQVIGSRIAQYIDVQYAFQELEDLPAGFSLPQGRTKPWGTGHAMLCCRDLIDSPFAVVNADDFYGRSAFGQIYNFLKDAKDTEQYQFAMVGYILNNTLVKDGHVSRGICVAQNGILQSVTERTHIEQRNGRVQYTEDGKNFIDIPAESTVSMNLWGFTPVFMNELDRAFPVFLQNAAKENPLKAEFFLPTVVNTLVQNASACVRVLPSVDKWYGMTYHSDKQIVVDAIDQMIASGVYPEKLWS